MKITEKEMLERKERIIQGAFSLFCERGIEQVTLAEIARKAGVGAATIYRYFTNKPLLVLSTMSVLWKSIGEELETAVKKSPEYPFLTGYEQFAVWLNACHKLYINNSDYVLFSYESKLYLQRNHIKLSAKQYDSLMESIKIPFLAALEKGKADGSIPIKDRSNEDVFYAIWGAVRGYIVKIVIYKALCSEESPWDSRYKVLQDGILCALGAGWKMPDRFT